MLQFAAFCEFARLLQIVFAREPTPLRVLEHYFMVACRKVGDIRRSEELQPSPGGRRRLGDKVWQTCCRVTTRDSEVEQREIYDRTVTAVIYLYISRYATSRSVVLDRGERDSVARHVGARKGFDEP